MESALATNESANNSDSVDSVHMQLLQKALEKTARKCVSSFKLSLLKQPFEPVYRKHPTRLKKLHEAALSELSSNIQEEFSVMLEEENIYEFMKKLDDMKCQAGNTLEQITAWRPSGVPSDDVRAHVHPVYRKHLQQLHKVFDQLQSQNTILQHNVTKLQTKLNQSQSAVLDHLDTWQKANCLTKEDRQTLENFAQAMV